jgi:uncharacterized protein
MFIFIPPSEGKAVPTDDERLSAGSLVFPELAETRRSLVESLIRLSTGPADKALSVLGLTEGQRGELEHNRRLTTAPTGPAAQVYSGVLYDALDLPGLRHRNKAAYRRAQESLLVFSGLWGVVRPEDRIPYYRCSAGVKLPDVGSVTAVWKAALAGPLEDLVGERLVVDLRSSAYAGLWRGRARAKTVTVRVLHERDVGGVLKRTVVSHWNKATKGRLVRALLLDGAEPKTAQEFADVLRDLGFTVENAGPGAVDVIVTEL